MNERLLTEEGNDSAGAVFRGLRNKFDSFTDEGIGEKWHTTFRYNNKSVEFARFFIVYYQDGLMIPNPVQISEIKWVSLDELKQNKKEYSLKTQYWIDNANWNKIMQFTRDFIRSGLITN